MRRRCSLHHPTRTTCTAGHHATRSPPSTLSRLRRAGGLMSYGTKICGRISPGRHLCRPYPQRCQARRTAGSRCDESTSWFSTSRPPGCSASKCRAVARARRRGDRMNGASSSHCSAARRRRGRSPRARSRASGCGGSACSCPQPRTMRNFRPAWRRYCKGWRNWAGSRPQRADRHPLGRRPMPPTFANTRRNWSRLRPDVILASGSSTVGPLLQATRTVPIVFTIVADPVGAGFVDSLARPGGNATGFMSYRIQHEREMAGVAQADRARRDAGGGHSGSATRPPESASLAPSRPWRRRSGWR